MKTIVSGKSYITGIMGKQIKKETNYRLMKYVLKNTCREGVLLQNAITGQMVLLDKEESSSLEQLTAANLEKLSELISSFFLVPVNYDEKATVDELRSIMKRIYPTKGVDCYTVYLTTNCNAHCYYCFESNYNHLNMSADIASRLVDYMLSHKSNGQLRIRWFGGEPLLNIPRIDQISEELKQRNIDFTSMMFSNGYLFSEGLVKKAVHSWNLKTIQITLDGTEEVYNKIKAYNVVNESPYQRVMQNIKLLLENDVYVKIRINIDKSNVDDVKALAEEIKIRFSQYPNAHVYSHFIVGNVGFTPEIRTQEDNLNLYQQQVDFTKMLYEEGLSRPDRRLPHLQFRCCMADKLDTLAVYPDGRLFLCDIVDEHKQVGHIDSDQWRYDVERSFQETIEFSNCAECQLYPFCINLKLCPGLESQNPSNCKFKKESITNNMLYHYNNALKTNSTKKVPSISDNIIEKTVDKETVLL